MEMLTKKTIYYTSEWQYWKIFSIILRRIWRYQMHMSIDVKCFTWIQLASSFHFLYVLGLFSSATHLLAFYPYYEIALMTSYTFYNKKVFHLSKDVFKTVFLVSQHASWLRLIRHKFTQFYQIFMIPADEIWLTDCNGSDISMDAEKMGRMKYPVGIKLGRILFKMGRILSDIRPLF